MIVTLLSHCSNYSSYLWCLYYIEPLSATMYKSMDTIAFQYCYLSFQFSAASFQFSEAMGVHRSWFSHEHCLYWSWQYWEWPSSGSSNPIQGVCVGVCVCVPNMRRIILVHVHVHLGHLFVEVIYSVIVCLHILYCTLCGSWGSTKSTVTDSWLRLHAWV